MNLQNNSNEMATIVETFIIEETANLIYDNEELEKWNNYIEELGLSGQTKIVSKDKSPIPFLHIKDSLKNVMECICPRKVSVEDYDISPIPNEILDLISLSKREKYFNKIQIWYDDKSPDPFCVGIKNDFHLYHYSNVPKQAKDGCYPTKEDALLEIRKYAPEFESTNTFGWDANITFYLLGKWADVKHSFDELKEIATKRYVSEKGNEYRKTIKEAQRNLDDLEIEAFEKFN